MKKILFFLTLAIPSFAARFDCTWAGGGSAGVWADALNWASCNGTYPNNGGGHTYSAAPAAGVTIPSGITIGHSISNWAVTMPIASPGVVTCVSASCPFVNGMIVEYTRQYNIGQPTIYPTGALAMARYCVDGVSGSPPQFNLKLDTCAGATANFTTSPAP
jgi:hypothetical protein